jgi:predicted RNase H-like HicB family nuclease
MKTYNFPVELEQEEDSRWSAWVELLPRCTVWGSTKEEALKLIQEASQAYIQIVLTHGVTIPKWKEIEVKDAPAVTVTI